MTQKQVKIEAICLHNRWYVRPAGQCGTCGFHPVPWVLTHIPRVRSEAQATATATAKAMSIRWVQKLLAGEHQ